MKRFRHLAFLLGSLAWLAVAGQKLPPAPNPPRLVNDFDNLLTSEQREHLESKLVAYDDSTSIQIAIVIVNTLQDYDPYEYATKLGREWGVGNKKTNNGVVLLVSTEPGKRKVFIAPGYGLEGALPDATCKLIVEQEIIPQFKQQNYFRGLDEATDAIIAASRGEYKAPPEYSDRGKGKGGGGIPAFVFIIIFVVLIFFIGGRGGRGGGGMMSRRGYRNFNGPPIMWFPPIGGGGSGGGGWSGGGGFGGFGGGSFGGGGAGGSW
jgi:uncharacterized protein